MMTKEEIETRIKRRLVAIEDSKSRLENIKPDWLPQVYFGIGKDAGDLALYYIFLGNKQEALEWLIKAAKYYEFGLNGRRAIFGTGSWENEAGRCDDFLRMAILSGDKELINAATAFSISIDSKFPTKHRIAASKYYYLQALSCVVLGKNNATDYSSKINVNSNGGKYKDFFGGLKTGVEGLSANDRSMILEGVTLLLKFQDRTYGKHQVTTEELVNLDAMVFIALARMKGISINANDVDEKLGKYVLWSLF